MSRDVNRWFEEHRWAGDALIAAPLLVLLTTIAAAQYYYSGPVRVVLLTVLLVLPLFARRTFPLATLFATVALCLLQLAVAPFAVPGDVVIPIVVHAAAAYIPDRRWGYAAFTAASVGSVIAAAQWGWEAFDRSSRLDWLGQVGFSALAGFAIIAAAYILGIRARDKRAHAAEQLAAMAAHNRLLVAERDSRVEASAAAERARIARELHDIVAHSLSVVIVQADGGAAAARANPEVGPQVLETIAETSRDALAQMRRMVSVLRAGPGAGDLAADFAPAAGPEDVPALVDQVRDTGLPVTLDVIGGARTLSPDAGLAIYRVVQESLTNVLKHAGPAASVQVVIHYGPREAIVTVTDDGRGAALGFTGGDDEPTATPGHGLQGMRERIGLLGGSVHAAPRVGGGFEVTAAIPYGTGAAALGPDSGAGDGQANPSWPVGPADAAG